MDEDETETLIELIQSRPALYDKRLKEYTDRAINKALWKEVCEAMVDSWNAMTPQEKTLKAKEIQQRWQNLRTCFKRELNRSKSGQASKKRRKYIYYNHLLFLLPSIDSKEKYSMEKMSENRVFENRNRNREEINSTYHIEQRRKNSLATPYDTSIFNLSKKKNTKEEIDEDKCFLLSLVPSFRRMTDDQKIDAKMQFLSVIRRINQSKPCSTNQVHEEGGSATFQYHTVQEIVNEASSDSIDICPIKIENINTP